MKKFVVFLASATVVAMFIYSRNTKPVEQIPSPASAAAVDYFLKIPGVDGESQDSRHEREIEVLSWSWGETQEGVALLLPAVQSARAGAGKPEFSDVSIHTGMNKASPVLMQSAASGKMYPEATLTGYRTGADGSQVKFMEIHLERVLVSSYQTGGSGQETIPMDTFSLNFGSIKFEYTPQKSDGQSDGSVVGGWDVQKNTPAQ